MPDAPTLTQQLLATVRDIEAGRAPLTAAQPMIHTLQSSLEPTRQQFLADADGNPEVPQESVPVVVQAFDRFKDGLAQMAAAIQQQSPQSLSNAAQVIDEAAAVIRRLRHEHYTALLQQGPTPFPFINRVLVHGRYLANGGTEIKHLTTTLQGYGEFANLVRRDVAAQQERVANATAQTLAEQGLQQVERALDDARTDLGRWSDLAMLQRQQAGVQICERLTAAANHLTTAFGVYLEADLAGPTPILLVNLVNRSFETWATGGITAEVFRQTVKSVQTALSQWLFPLSGTPLAATAERLKGSLESIGTAAQDDRADQVRPLLPPFLEAANEVASAVGTTSGDEDDEEVVDFVEVQGQATRAPQAPNTLPANLQHLLDVANSFLNGQVKAADLVDTLDQFDRMMDGTRQRGETTPGAESLLPAMNQGLDLLKEATQTLRALAQQRDARMIGAARSLMTQAAEKLMEVGGLG